MLCLQQKPNRSGVQTTDYENLSALCHAMRGNLSRTCRQHGGPIRKQRFLGGDRCARTQSSGIRETGERKKDKFVAMFYWTWHIYDMPPGSQVNKRPRYSANTRKRSARSTIRPGIIRAGTTGSNPFSDTIKRPTRGCCVNTPRCWPTQGSTSFFSTVRT